MALKRGFERDCPFRVSGLSALDLSPLQGSFGKRSDSPSAAADADASDVQSVDSSLSRRGAGTNKRDTVCQVNGGTVQN